RPYGANSRGRAGRAEVHHRPVLRLPEPRGTGGGPGPGRGSGVLPPLLGQKGLTSGSPPLRRGRGGAMRAASSRFIAVWASHEARARIWFRLFAVTLACLVLSLFT